MNMGFVRNWDKLCFKGDLGRAQTCCLVLYLKFCKAATNQTFFKIIIASHGVTQEVPWELVLVLWDLVWESP